MACYAGDVISHGHNTSTSYHSQIVYEYTIGVTPRDLKCAQHSDDYIERSLRYYLEYRNDNGQGDEYILLIEIW